jgi:predicted transposase YbfD/YdcC
MQKFINIFRELPDPRAPNAVHDLVEILFIALAAVLSGAQGPTDMAVFAASKEKLLRQFLRLEYGTPSHDTFGRVFGQLDPVGFESIFRRFMAAFAAANKIDLGGIVAIDGKALRGAYERGKAATPMHLVNVFAGAARMVLASRKAPGRNEAKGALEVLAMLSLEGCTVTADAQHCNRPFAAAVLARGGNFVLALKANQSKLFEAVVRRFARSGGPRSTAQTLEPATHDRKEKRSAVVIRDTSIAAANKFPGVVALARIATYRRVQGKPADKPVVRYFLLSTYMSAKRLLQIVRSHWGIENRLHWILDVVFHEDASRTRKDNGPENLAILRRLALNIIRSHPDRISMRQKLKRAAWDDNFLLQLVAHMR